METTARRYSTPPTPPRLVVGVRKETSSALAPVLCLHCGGATGHTAPGLVSFAWGRVAPTGLRR